MSGAEVWSTFRARVRVRRITLLVIAGLVLAASAALPLGSDQIFVPVAGSLAFLGEMVLFVLLVGGWLGDELGSGAALFWVQTPHSPLALYGRRFVGVAVLAGLMASLLPVAVAGVLAMLGHSGGAIQILVRTPPVLLTLTVLAVLIWGVGGWGVRGDAWAGPLVGAGLAALELVARLQPARLGVLAGPADLVGVPLDAMDALAPFLTGRAGDAAAALPLLLWLLAWIVVGAVGVARTTRRTSGSDRGA